MKDNRKRVNVHPIVKDRVEDLKKKLGLRTESEVIFFLLEVNKEYADQIRQKWFEKTIDDAKKVHRDQTILF